MGSYPGNGWKGAFRPGQQPHMEVSVEITQAKVKYKGELLPRAKKKFSEGLFRRLKELGVYLEDSGESLEILNGGRT